MNGIIENATIIYKNGNKEIYDAISISDKGVYTGQIKNINKKNHEFINHSFIPIDQIRQILFFNKNNKLMDIDTKKLGGK